MTLPPSLPPFLSHTHQILPTHRPFSPMSHHSFIHSPLFSSIQALLRYTRRIDQSVYIQPHPFPVLFLFLFLFLFLPFPPLFRLRTIPTHHCSQRLYYLPTYLPTYLPAYSPTGNKAFFLSFRTNYLVVSYCTVSYNMVVVGGYVDACSDSDGDSDGDSDSDSDSD